jgi:pyrimidine operon attenuation protein/uracil phosphoribosyltransferase
MTTEEIVGTATEVAETLRRMGQGLSAQLAARGIGGEEALLIGIHTGGVWVAEDIAAQLRASAPVGRLNIAFYRDDFSRIGNHPTITPSVLPFPVDDRHVVLVDDILYTGRTIRAAMNEIFDHGRPASITLAVLVDRGERELPIAADVSGMVLRLAPGESLKLRGPSPLTLHRVKTSRGP